MMEEIPYEETYQYVDPRTEGAERKTTRTLWNVIHHYRTPYDSVYDGVPTKMVRIEEATHPGFLKKIVAVLLYPVSVIMHGAPDATRETWRFLFDRRYGSFTSHTYFRKAIERNG
jgi:hypothetical protein